MRIITVRLTVRQTDRQTETKQANARAYPYGEHYSYDCYRDRDKKIK